VDESRTVAQSFGEIYLGIESILGLAFKKKDRSTNTSKKKITRGKLSMMERSTHGRDINEGTRRSLGEVGGTWQDQTILRGGRNSACEPLERGGNSPQDQIKTREKREKKFKTVDVMGKRVLSGRAKKRLPFLILGKSKKLKKKRNTNPTKKGA